jgi:hypothetical protein
MQLTVDEKNTEFLCMNRATLFKRTLRQKESGTGLPDVIYIFKPKIPIWVTFGGCCIKKCWYAYIMAIWSNLRQFGRYI